MCEANACQMTYRYLWRRKGYILLIVTTLVALYIWSDSFNSYDQYGFDEYGTNCKFPCWGQFCLDCETKPPTTVKVINIVEHLNLKQALRGTGSNLNPSSNVSSSGQVCKRPNFDLKHDSVKYAFYKLPPLNCTGEELFYLENNVFRFNKTQLGNRELDKCKYYGVERVSDDYSIFTEPLVKESEPFDIILMHDFVRIKCFLKTDEKSEEKDIKFDNDVEIRNMTSLELPHQLDSESKNLNRRNENVREEIKMGNSENPENLGGVNVQRVYRSIKSVNDYDIEMEVEEENNSTELKEDDYDVYWNRVWEGNYFYTEEKADFDQLFVQVVPKSEVFERINSKRESRLKERQMNVLMFGLDSMSHLSYQRKLPKTYQYLKELGAVVMDGYNIVGDATTAALIPMLTGKTEMELPETRKNRWESEVVDVYPLIWKKFQEKGYVTMFGEDEPTIGVFNLRLNGFRDQPTDHYMRPFWESLWETELRKDSPRYCTGSVPNHMHLLNYMRDFYTEYANVSKFAFMFGSELTHWDNNPGEYMDDDFVELLAFLKKEGHMDNTLLIAFADHGARYSKVRQTVQGKLEERLPFMSLTFPEWFQTKYSHLYSNLQNNADRLTTPFDIHETLVDVLDLRRVESRANPKQRGISLIRRVPPDRTCSDADIQLHWCTCLKQLELDAKDKHVQNSITALVNFINKVTKRMRQFCAELSFHRLHHAMLLVPNEKVLMFLKSSDDDNRVANFTRDVKVDHLHFQVTIETIPNHGVYESTIQVNMTSGEYTVIETEISRLDMYGSQPACVQEKYPDLRKYCYCIKQEKRNGTLVL